jgi:hypothetical protein
MRNLNKYILTILLLLIMDSVPAQRLGYREITEKRIEFIAPRLSLTARESEKFWPLFREFYDRREEISRKTKEKNSQQDNKPPMNNEEFLNAIRFLIDSKMDQVTLMKEYTGKYLEVLPPEKVYRLLQLEEEFNRALLNQLKESGPGRKEPEPGRKEQDPERKRPSS